jgi:membrane protein required for colicin V production
MTAIDILILVIIAGGLGRGFMVGAVRQVTGLIGVVLAFALAVQLMRPAGEALVASLGLAPSLVPVLGFITVFAVVQIVFFLLGQVVEQVIDALSLSPVNRLLGSLVGGFKAALLLSVAFLLFSHINIPAEQTRNQSMLYAPVAQVLPRTWAFAEEHVPSLKSLSEEFGDHIESGMSTARDEVTQRALNRDQ